jgi:uncharacterized membrane protein (UPF0182 family)
VGDLVRRRLGTVVVLGLLLVLFSANRIAVLTTDLWWYDERGFRGVFTTQLLTRVGLGFAFGAFLAVLIAANLLIARRLRPFYVPSSPQQAQVQRYREMADPYLPWLIAGIALLFGATSGLAISAAWDTFLLWLRGGSVGTVDPQFGVDIGFYLFRLPFWSLLQTWLFTSLVLATLLTAGAHYLLGGIRPEAEGEKVLPSVKAHLAVLVAAILAVRAWGYWLDRYNLLYSDRGTVTGASYTDVNAELPALYLLIGVSVIAIALVLLSMRRAGFLLPGAALALLVVASIVLQGAYPAAIQRLRVDPQELTREQEFIARNLEATRAAYGLDEVSLQPFSIANDLDEADVIENDVTLRNVRLWEPEVLETTFQQIQALRPYYQFNDVAIDRYEIDGELRQVMIATRDLSQLPPGTDSWQNRHITYTHGFGVVASQVNTANDEGQPVFLSSNIPPAGRDELVPVDEGRNIYYGLFTNPAYSLVRTDERELNYESPDGSEQIETRYDGNGGVGIGSFARRLAFALRFGDYNLMLTGLITDESRIIFNREVTGRVASVAPFLELDAAPYPAVVDGRVVWIVDAYTTSNQYPYSERTTLNTTRATPVNYVRNSVKAVVDAFHGDITLYRVEEDDPVLDAWEQIFPGVIETEPAPESVSQHFRYPQDMFRLQSQLYQLYHIQEATAFYSRADAWSIPRDPTVAANQTGGGAAGNATVDALATGTDARPLRPYYLLMRLPGEETEEFVLIQPYLAQGRENMVAWLAGRSDGQNLGDLFAVRFPTDSQVLGPLQAQARIEQDDDISAYITLRDRDGVSVRRGQLQILPIADSLLYAQPLFLLNPQAQIPELARVALVMGERTAFDTTFAGALGQLLGIEVPDTIADDEGRELDIDPVTGEEIDPDETDETDDTTEDDGEAAEPEPDATSEELLGQALRAFADAELALRDGDLSGYERETRRGIALIEEAAEVMGVTVDELFEEGDEGTTDQDLLDDLDDEDPADTDAGEDALGDPSAMARVWR